jgi:hypothetical protein
VHLVASSQVGNDFVKKADNAPCSRQGGTLPVLFTRMESGAACKACQMSFICRFGETTLAGRYLLGRITYLVRVTNEQRPLYDNASFPFTQYAPNSTTIQVPRENATEYAPVRYTAQVPLRSNVFGLDVSGRCIAFWLPLLGMTRPITSMRQFHDR